MDRMPSMKCNCCGGPMLYDQFFSSSDAFWGWKCLMCGEIIDPVILENRRLMREGRGIELTRARRSSAY